MLNQVIINAKTTIVFMNCFSSRITWVFVLCRDGMACTPCGTPYIPGRFNQTGQINGEINLLVNGLAQG